MTTRTLAALTGLLLALSDLPNTQADRAEIVEGIAQLRDQLRTIDFDLNEAASLLSRKDSP